MVVEINNQTKYSYFHFWRSYGCHNWTEGRPIGEEPSGTLLPRFWWHHHSNGHVIWINTYVPTSEGATLTNAEFQRIEKYKWTPSFWYCDILECEPCKLVRVGSAERTNTLKRITKTQKIIQKYPGKWEMCPSFNNTSFKEVHKGIFLQNRWKHR